MYAYSPYTTTLWEIHGVDAADMTLVDMLSGPICAMVWEGRDAVKTGRSMSPIYMVNGEVNDNADYSQL